MCVCVCVSALDLFFIVVIRSLSVILDHYGFDCTLARTVKNARAEYDSQQWYTKRVKFKIQLD